MTDSDSSLPTVGVRGTFRDYDSVVRAVERLAEESVPADSIRVFVENPSGVRREVPVDDESGVLRGATIGAGVGALGGLLLVVAVATGLLGQPGVGLFSVRGISGAFGTILGAAASAVPLGALLGLGRWRGRKKISPEDLAAGAATVEVRSSERSEIARRVLEDAGGHDVRFMGPAT